MIEKSFDEYTDFDFAQRLSLLAKLEQLFSYRSEIRRTLRENDFLSFSLWNFEIFGETCTEDELNLIDAVSEQFDRLYFRTYQSAYLGKRHAEFYFAIRRSLPLLDHSDRPQSESEFGYRGPDLVRRARSMATERRLRGIYNRSIPTALWNFIEDGRAALREHEKARHGLDQITSAWTPKRQVFASAQSICSANERLREFAATRSTLPELMIIPITENWELRYAIGPRLIPLHGVCGSAQLHLILCHKSNKRIKSVGFPHFEIPYSLFPGNFSYGGFNDISEFQVYAKVSLLVLEVVLDDMVRLIREWLLVTNEVNPWPG